MTEFRSDHSLGLSDWGPYTKKYAGISHVADAGTGARFDLAVFPGLYRKKIDVPNVRWESGFHPWEASPDLRYYRVRYELEWKDRLYVDVSYAALAEDARLVRCECVNASGLTHDFVLHLFASLQYPTIAANSEEALRPAVAVLPEGWTWIDALDFTDLSFATPRPGDSLVYDGLRRAEARRHGAVGGSVVGCGFGRDAGDRAAYRFESGGAGRSAIDDALLLVRCRSSGPCSALIGVDGDARRVELPGSGRFDLTPIPVGRLDGGAHELLLASVGGSSIEVDGFAIGPSSGAAAVAFPDAVQDPVPRLERGPAAGSLSLAYRGIPHRYGISWRYPEFEIREFHVGELDRYLRNAVHEHVRTVFHGDGGGHWTNVFLRPIPIPPGERRIVYAVVCSGSVEKYAALSETGMERIHDMERGRRFRFSPAPSGGAYGASQDLMAATTLTNVVYPIYTKRSYVKHNTPGRWWDSLYTWDSGFLGLGLLELDIQRARDCLAAYLTRPGDKEAAFIHHGSMVPTQFALFRELMNRSGSTEDLSWCYPRLLQYYRFLAGRHGSSNTGKLASGILKTWDYFYNSGGWDDYPAQVHVHRNKLEDVAAPMITSSQLILCGRILESTARELGHDGDISEFRADRERLTNALQTHAWDEESGYFGYVVHDDHGRPTGILRDESGANLNMGLDGLSPFVAGVCTPAQRGRVVEHLFDPQGLWTRIGLQTVDAKAPYYRRDGYWNGAVWMPHQWYVWKALLDAGLPEKARLIAERALDLWKEECDASYNCYEHFIVHSGRGAGWHQFSGLSSPVLKWFSAYHLPGRLSTGFGVRVRSARFQESAARLRADIEVEWSTGERSSVIARMAPAEGYRATFSGAPCQTRQALPGAVEILLPAGCGAGTLVVDPA